MAATARAVYGPTPGNASSAATSDGTRPAVLVDDEPRGAPQVERATVVAEPLPGPQDVGGRDIGQRLDRREQGHERDPRLTRPGRLGLLGHRLGDEDRVRVGRATERQRPAARRIPGEDGIADCDGDRVGRGSPPYDMGPRVQGSGDAVRCRVLGQPDGLAGPVARPASPAKAAGWDSLWIDDHLLADEGDPTDSKFEGWATLAALAVLTERVRLGLLVAANTFRSPGLTAKLATTVDHLSGGRVVLGIGGGWFEREHDAFGLDFGAGFGERLDRLDEATG